MKRFSARKNIVLCSVSAAIVVCLVVATVITTLFSKRISEYFNQETSVIVNTGEPIYTSSFSSPAKVRVHDEAVSRDIESEGIVLLENKTVLRGGEETPSLPLERRASITVFGTTSADLLYADTEAASSAVEDAEPITLYRALEESGFYVNPDVREFYESGAGSSYRRRMPNSGATSVRADDLAAGEAPTSAFPSELVSSFSGYDDAAVIVLGRSGGNGYDIPRERGSDGKYYREPSAEELGLIAFVRERFDNVVLVINSSSPMMLGCIEDEEYAVDSVLWVGNPGSTGARAIGYVLSGYVVPSGRLTETWTYDHTSAPSSANFGASEYLWQGGSPAAYSDYYTVLAEGIYIGYRYYETRCEDYVCGRENVGEFEYDSVVQYPFGYGLSYTSFAVTPPSVTYNEETQSYDVSVAVANTGTVPGKEVVQVYMQAPYGDDDIAAGTERPSVELVGYEKTALIPAAGGEEDNFTTVTVSVPKTLLETYDPTAAGGAGGYVTRGGTYYFAVATDAHDALCDIMKYKADAGVVSPDPDRLPEAYGSADASSVYAFEVEEVMPEPAPDAGTEGSQDGAAVPDADNGVSVPAATDLSTEGDLSGVPTNKFAAADIRTHDEEFRYLTRSDWEGTFPETYADGHWVAPDEVRGGMIPDVSYMTEGTAGADSPNAAGGLTAFDLIGAEYGDVRFRYLADMLSRSEKAEYVRMGGNTISSLGAPVVPETRCRDGQAGVNPSVIYYSPVINYPSAAVVAATWNDELAAALGECLSEDALGEEISGVFAPCLNIRRDPFGGGNGRSFGEDPLLIGRMGAAEVRGLRTKMCFAFIGDFAFASQEDRALGLSVWGDEQTLRTIYLRPFEIAVREGGACAVLQSASRIGTTWVGAHKGLMTDILRTEWGFEGMTLTARDGDDAFMDFASGIVAGTDMWFNNDPMAFHPSDAQLGSAAVSEALTRAAANIIYTVTASNAMNGITADTRVERIIPPWQVIYIVLACVVLAAALSMPIIVLVNRILTRKKTDSSAYFTTITWDK